MANPPKLGARKNASFMAISSAPSINKTPSDDEVAYPVAHDLSNSVGTVSSVRFNDDTAYVLDQSTQPLCIGDEEGSNGGVKSGTVNGEVKPVKGSTTVRVGGKPILRDGDPCTLNGGNCPGTYVVAPAPSGSIEGGWPTDNCNPALEAETPEEEAFLASGGLSAPPPPPDIPGVLTDPITEGSVASTPTGGDGFRVLGKGVPPPESQIAPCPMATQTAAMTSTAAVPLD